MEKGLRKTTTLYVWFARSPIIQSHYYFAMGKEADAKGLAIYSAWGWNHCQRVIGSVPHVWHLLS
jgi:hypothetical protein